jgi:hypothetical protein
MATLGNNVRTLQDWAKDLDPDGSVAAVIEMMSKHDPILEDMFWREGNLPTGDRITTRVGLPTVYWRSINQGIPPSKSKKTQATEGVGMLEAWSETDQELAELGGHINEARASESKSFIEAMTQEHSSTLFYGNASISPEEFTGLSVRYSSLSANNAQNIVVGGGSDVDNTSIWLIVWGEDTIHGIFPKGSTAGLEHEDLGLVTVEVTAGIAGNRMRAYQDHYRWKTGISLKDWRFVVRIPNIDVSALVAESSAANLTKLMIKAVHRIPNLMAGKAVFYMNRTVFQMLDIQRYNNVTTGGQLSYPVVDGKEIPSFRGIPIKTCDSILNTEALVA